MLLDSNVLIIFIKYPQPGLVKTRMAKEIGKEAAALLYRLCVEAVLTRIKDDSFARAIFYYPAEKETQIKEWLGCSLSVYPQKGNDLGERLTNAFELTFKKGAKRVVAIGTDSPAIGKEIIPRAFKELEDKGCVIGPALDGGYYLLGLSSFHKDVFNDIAWGTDKVFKQTLSKIEGLGLKFSALDRHLDLDNAADLITLKHHLEEIVITQGAADGLSPIVEFVKEITTRESETENGGKWGHIFDFQYSIKRINLTIFDINK